jgi:hypothetical protein
MPKPLPFSYGIWKGRGIGTCLISFHFLMVFGRGGGRHMPNSLPLSYGVWKGREVGTCLTPFHYLMVFGRGGR